jgi:sec-independent protein translocase protein TatC
MELTEHLGELRARIIRSIVYWVICGIVTYFLFTPLYNLLFYPLQQAAQGRDDVKIIFNNFMNPFMVVLQVSVIGGLIMALPAITLEMWGFLAPALTPDERKPIKIVAPASIVLFMGGVTLGYFVAKSAIKWLLGFLDFFPGAVLYQDPRTYVIFMVKILAVFGVMFQLPVVLAFLAHVGIVKSAAMKKYWRHAIVGIAFVGMLVTPTNDAGTMLLMVVPVFILYLFSIWIVSIVERKRDRRLNPPGD